MSSIPRYTGLHVEDCPCNRPTANAATTIRFIVDPIVRQSSREPLCTALAGCNLFGVDAADEAGYVHRWPVRIPGLELAGELRAGSIGRDALLFELQRTVAKIADELLLQPDQGAV